MRSCCAGEARSCVVVVDAPASSFGCCAPFCAGVDALEGIANKSRVRFSIYIQALN